MGGEHRRAWREGQWVRQAGPGTVLHGYPYMYAYVRERWSPRRSNEPMQARSYKTR